MKLIASIVLAVATLAAVPACAQDAESIAQAKAAAGTWLALVDAGNYSAGWQQSAGLFKSAVTSQSFASSVQSARAPLGALKSRTVQSATYSHTLPGAPDGDYVVIRYDSSFANKGSAVETVTPLKDKDGSWRVSGYYVK